MMYIRLYFSQIIEVRLKRGKIVFLPSTLTLLSVKSNGKVKEGTKTDGGSNKEVRFQKEQGRKQYFL